MTMRPEPVTKMREMWLRRVIIFTHAVPSAMADTLQEARHASSRKLWAHETSYATPKAPYTCLDEPVRFDACTSRRSGRSAQAQQVQVAALAQRPDNAAYASPNDTVYDDGYRWRFSARTGLSVSGRRDS